MSPDTKDILQITLPTVVPTLAVLIGILLNNRQVAMLETSLNRRIDDLRADMRSGFAAIDKRIDDLRSDMIARFTSTERLFDEKLKALRR